MNSMRTRRKGSIKEVVIFVALVAFSVVYLFPVLWMILTAFRTEVDLEINETSETVTRDGCPVDLTDTEYEVLHLLVKNRRQIFSAERLYEAVWQEPYYYGANNTVMVHIRNLRRKIEKDPKNPELIKTVWGRGYRCD